jgi:hypothetical protein
MKVDMAPIMVRPLDDSDLTPSAGFHALSRNAAHDGLVPADALAR